MISNNGERVGVNRKIKRRVPNSEIQIALKPNAQFGFRRRKVGRWNPNIYPTKGEPKGQKGKEGKVDAGAVRFACLASEENGPEMKRFRWAK